MICMARKSDGKNSHRSRPPTPKQLVWLNAYTDPASPMQFNASAAARVAYPRASPGSARVIGHRLMKKFAAEKDVALKDQASKLSVWLRSLKGQGR